MSIRFSPLYSSSSGNATFVASETTNILVDAGTTGKAIESALCSLGEDAARISAILVTHEHTDHIKGVGVLSRKYNIPVYANVRTWEAMDAKIGNVSLENTRVIENNSEFYIGDICAQSFSLSHDAADPVGYAVMAGGRKIGILTDTGRVTRTMFNVLEDASVVLLESNHDEALLKGGMYPYYLKKRILSNKGHLSNVAAAEAGVELIKRGVKGLVLSHISSQNNHKQLAYETVTEILEAEGAKVGKDVAVMAANRKSATGMFPLK